MATAFITESESTPIIARTEMSIRIGTRIDATADGALRTDIADHLTAFLGLNIPAEPAPAPR